MPKVSVCVAAYNQEKYIAKCLQSIVDQKTYFDFEIIVADDFSKDKTTEILKEFQLKYPDKINLILNSENIGPTQNTLNARSFARGKYICHCDGDDFFYPEKLMFQYEFMEGNSEYIATWHAVDVYSEDGSILKSNKNRKINESKITKIELSDLLAFGSWGANSSLMYRYDGVPFRTDKHLMYDFEFSLKLLEKGSGAILHNVLGGYRKASIGSLTTSLNNNGLNKQRLDQLTLWVQYVEKHKSLRKFVGLYALQTIFKIIVKREKLSIDYFKHLTKILFMSADGSVLSCVARKILG